MLSGFEEMIRRFYGNTAAPDWSRMHTLTDDGGPPLLYPGLLRALRADAPVEDVSDFNYDVCLTWHTPSLDATWRVSLVGPWALVVRHGLVDPTKHPELLKATGLFIDAGFSFPAAEALRAEVDFFEMESGRSRVPLGVPLFSTASPWPGTWDFDA